MDPASQEVDTSVKNVLALASTLKPFMNNGMLNPELMKCFIGGPAMTKLVSAAQEAGYTVMTSDVFLREKPTEKALLVSEMGAGYWCRRKEFIPAVCMSLESPLVAWQFYHFCPWIAGSFEHVYLWPGTRDRLQKTKARFHNIYWPNEIRRVLPGPAWHDRSFLVLVSSNKSSSPPLRLSYDSTRPLKSVARIGFQTVGLLVNRIDKLVYPDGYMDRLHAIEYFAKKERLDLYGFGWDEPIQQGNNRLRPLIDGCYRGSLAPGSKAKLATLSKYKFAICYENTRFPGYVTEKIFDCFFAGCIPVYLGAPDIGQFVPTETFIDFGEFNAYGELEQFLLSISAVEASRYLEAAQSFIESERFDRFHVNHYVKRILRSVNEVAARYA